MKPQKFLLLLSSAFLLASCGSTPEEPKDDNPTEQPGNTPGGEENPGENPGEEENPGENPGGEENPGEEENPGDDNKDVLSVSVKRPNGTPETGAYVRWCKGIVCYPPVKVDANGVAKSNFELEEGATYTVHLDLPEESDYAYNPNIYSQTSGNLDITLTSILLKSESGKQDYANINDLGVYQANIKAKNAVVKYNFTPKASGIYTIESWVEETEFFTPEIALLNVLGNPMETPSLEAPEHNFKTTIEVYQDQVDAHISFPFQVKSNFASLVNFEVSKTGESNGPDVATEVPVTATLVKQADQSGALIPCDIYAHSTIVYGSDGLYHLDTAEGPVLYADLTKIKTIYDIYPGALIVEEGKESYITFYETYRTYTNRDLAYPLNAELMTFFTKLATTIQIFNPELGNVSSDFVPDTYSAVLYYSGYYVISGTEENPVLLDVSRSGEFSYTLAANETLYISFDTKEPVTMTVTPDENTELSYEDYFTSITYSFDSENPLVITNDFPAALYALTTVSKAAGQVSIEWEVEEILPTLQVGRNSVLADGKKGVEYGLDADTGYYRITTTNGYIVASTGEEADPTSSMIIHYQWGEEFSFNIYNEAMNGPEIEVDIFVEKILYGAGSISGWGVETNVAFISNETKEYNIIASIYTDLKIPNKDYELLQTVEHGTVAKYTLAKNEEVILHLVTIEEMADPETHEGSLSVTVAEALPLGSTTLNLGVNYVTYVFTAEEAGNYTFSITENGALSFQVGESSSYVENTTPETIPLSKGQSVVIEISWTDFLSNGGEVTVTVAKE